MNEVVGAMLPAGICKSLENVAVRSGKNASNNYVDYFDYMDCFPCPAKP